MLLVVVDQPRIRRGGEDSVERASERDVPRVPVEHRRLAFQVADAREPLDPRQCVERVPAKETGRRLDRPALAPMLVAPVLAALRLFRRLEVEVGGPPRRPRGPRKDYAQDVAVPVLRDQLAEGEELRNGLRRVPLAQIPARARPASRQRLDARGHVP